ncbi:MAG: undecaprenyl-diphosphatase UppP [Bacilli bacterium]|nr:undecaprenyl-diphosphatase UppP [Bacilli bacterium]
MFEIVILGIIQGIAEFLPISSSAHLLIFRDVFGIGRDIIGSDIDLAFDIALHFGTLCAIGVYFFKDFLKMFISGFTKGVKEKEGRMLWFIVAATIPAAIVGLLFEDIIDSFFRKQFILIAIALIVMGIIIYLVDKKMPNKKNLDKMNLKDALIVGCSQVFALVPGFSRSGTTIAASRCLKINREDAAKFSFYLSAPVVLGSVILTLLEDGMLDLIIANSLPFIVGVVVSFISGLLCISFLLKFLRKNDFKLFMVYRIILGIIVIALVLFK